MIFAVAISMQDSRGNEKVRAFSMDAKNRAAALGESFIRLSHSGEAFIIKGWDISSCGDEVLLDAIRPHVIDRKKIRAIKAMREVDWSYGLREAKEFVEAHWYDWEDLPV
jgi:hypothetical protein